MSDATVAAFTIYGGFVTGGYFTLTGYRDGSVNRVEREYVKATGYGRTFDDGKWRNSDNEEATSNAMGD